MAFQWQYCKLQYNGGTPSTFHRTVYPTKLSIKYLAELHIQASELFNPSILLYTEFHVVPYPRTDFYFYSCIDFLFLKSHIFFIVNLCFQEVEKAHNIFMADTFGQYSPKRPKNNSREETVSAKHKALRINRLITTLI